MNRGNESFATATRLWTRFVDRPVKDAYDALHDLKERILTRLFLGNEIGRWIYNRTDANWWTRLRLYTCWIPPLLIMLGFSIAACVTTAIIWTTDLVDGWFARKKQQESDEGMRFETTVDTAFKLLTFAAIIVRYPNVRQPMSVAALSEFIRIAGAVYIRRKGSEPKPNRSGKFKTLFYVAATGTLLLFSESIAVALVKGGIVLSWYSMLMHWIEYQVWRRLQEPRH